MLMLHTDHLCNSNKWAQVVLYVTTIQAIINITQMNINKWN